MKRPTLSCGLTYGLDLLGHRICTGAQMGRSNTLPDDSLAPIKLQMVRLRMVDDGAYDEKGCYWGAGQPLYHAAGDDAEIFVRAYNRAAAKEEVRELLPNARFYR